MNPHDLMKKIEEGTEPGEGFTERVLSEARRRRAAKPRRRLAAALIAAVVLLGSLTTAVSAVPELRHWLFGVVGVEEPDRAGVEAQIGDLDLTVDCGKATLHFGSCFCVGRFLFAEVEASIGEDRPFTDADLASAWEGLSDRFTLIYAERYWRGQYLTEDEGYHMTRFRLDDGSEPGRARYTFCWTLARADYEGTTLLVQVWEPIQWETMADGSKQAVNRDTRKKLAEVRIERRRPDNERVYSLADGSEVRVCSFGVEIRGKAFTKLPLQSFRSDKPGADEGYDILWGAVLADGTRVPFLMSGWIWDGGAVLKDEEVWSALPFSASIDPGKVTALYFCDELLPLQQDKP